MGGLVMLERFVWFDRELKSGRYPNASRLARKFEVSVKTAQRTIDFMRDRFFEFTYQSPGTGRVTMFPVYAGMNRKGGSLVGIDSNVPRIRGDEPMSPKQISGTYLCSLHTRG